MKPTDELTDAELLQLWARLPRRSRQKLTVWLFAEDRRAQRPTQQRGPRPKAYARDRQLERLWNAYKAAHRGASVNAHGAKFLATLPEPLRPKITNRGGEQSTKNLSRSIKRGRELSRQRPALRRLVAALRASVGLAAIGTRTTRAARAVVKAGRAGRRDDLAEIERLTAEHQFWNDNATRALLGDEAVDAQSFIRFPPQK
jgi:hypothetical protein